MREDRVILYIHGEFDHSCEAKYQAEHSSFLLWIHIVTKFNDTLGKQERGRSRLHIVLHLNIPSYVTIVVHTISLDTPLTYSPAASSMPYHLTST